MPFGQDIKGGTFIESILLSLVLLSAVLAVGGRRSTLVVALSLGVPTVAARWINHFRPDLVPPSVFLVGGLILITAVVGHLLYFVLRAPLVNIDVLCASISAYILLGLVWTIAYWLLDQFVPDAFALTKTTATKESMVGFNAFYFSFVTLSTVGYGNITPVSRSRACLQPWKR
jgi:hypothetical protein